MEKDSMEKDSMEKDSMKKDSMKKDRTFELVELLFVGKSAIAFSLFYKTSKLIF